MKFLADMGISPDTVRFLRSLGYDAVHLTEEGLHRLSDAEILQKAHDEGRTLLTSDLGFGELLASAGASLPSVIIFRLSDMRPQSVNVHLITLLDQFSRELEQGAIASVTERRVRLRMLPLRK